MSHPALVRPKYLQMEGFLTAAEHQELIDAVETRARSLVASSVIKENSEAGAIDHDIRQSHIATDTSGVAAMFEGRLKALLPHVRKETGLDWFQLADIETQLTGHGNGDFFTLHTDNGSVGTRSRAMTYVYYFNVPPKRFDGGELVLYESKLENGFYVAGDVAEIIEPTDNSVVFFPSNTFHEVRPVRCGFDDPQAWRYSVNGWFHAMPSATDIALVDNLTNAQRTTLPQLRTPGFEIADTNTDLFERFMAARLEGAGSVATEVTDRSYFPGGSPTLSAVGLDTTALLDELLAEHATWAGCELEGISVYGFRTFTKGQSMRPHCMRTESHVVSTLFNVSDADHESWTVDLLDEAGTYHQLELRPGQHLRYESARLAVGHATPLEQDSATYLMVHYRPVGWDWTEARVWEAVAEANR